MLPSRSPSTRTREPAHKNRERAETGQALEKAGVPGVTRTPDPQFRKLLLYPAELRGRGPHHSSGPPAPAIRWHGVQLSRRSGAKRSSTRTSSAWRVVRVLANTSARCVRAVARRHQTECRASGSAPVAPARNRSLRLPDETLRQHDVLDRRPVVARADIAHAMALDLPVGQLLGIELEPHVARQANLIH